jgi:hypothetical protein
MLIGKGQDEVVKHHLGIGGKNQFLFITFLIKVPASQCCGDIA